MKSVELHYVKQSPSHIPSPLCPLAAEHPAFHDTLLTLWLGYILLNVPEFPSCLGLA